MRAAGHDLEAGRRFAEDWKRLSRPENGDPERREAERRDEQEARDQYTTDALKEEILLLRRIITTLLDSAMPVGYLLTTEQRTAALERAEELRRKLAGDERP